MNRVLIYSTAYLPFIGGAEVAVKEITDRLPNFEFDLITAWLDKKLPRRQTIGRVNVYRVGIGYPKFDKLFLAVFGHFQGLKLHRQNKYQAVWAIMASFGGFAALSFKIRSKIPYLLTLQEGDPIEEILKQVRFVRNRFNKIFSQASGLQAISTYLLNWGVSMGFKGKFSEIIPNGVDVTNFTKQYSEEEIKELRSSFGFPKDAVIVVTASRLVVKNGLADVIKALPNLPQNFCFYICGTGGLENHLRQLVKELKLEKRVNFAGYKSHAELPSIFSSSDIFIRPSLSEGLGNAFLEAMASGLPTIGTLVGGIPDFLTDGVTGLVCQAQNPSNIASTILKASQLNAEQKKSLHDNATKLINERYNWDLVANKMNNLLEKLCK
ncbi:MAG: glycosyltransferase family 4 protein [Patescibacteria group bacterium]|jgi:glycosyltransferase involved in cell wall biosynthesis